MTDMDRGKEIERVDHPAQGAPVGEEDVDEELLSLPAAAPSARHGFVILVFLALSGYMIYWFLPDLEYLLCAIRGPRDLGEAADLDPGELDDDTWVSVSGIPQMNRSITFNEGVRWFASSDTSVRFFPLTGQPRLFVQWRAPAEHKAYRSDPTALPIPSSFEGRLVRRDQLGGDFDRIWILYDCLKGHPMRRCKRCLGRDSLDDCRRAFTCLERQSPEECARILERSPGPLGEEIAALEARISEGSGSDEDRRRLGELEVLRSSLREQLVEELAVRLEEVSARAARLERIADPSGDDRDELRDLRADALALRLSELKVRASEPLGRIAALGGDERAALGRSLEEMEDSHRLEEAQIRELEVMRDIASIGDQIDDVKERSQELRRRIAAMGPDLPGGIDGWSLDPQTRDGGAILSALGALDRLVGDRAAPSGIPSGDAGTDAGQGGADGGARGEEPDPAAGPADPVAARIAGILEALEARFEEIQGRIAALAPGDNPGLEKWATKPDVMGRVPEGIRVHDVIGSLATIEGMLAGVEPAPGPGDLAKRLEEGIDRLAAIRERRRELEAASGIGEIAVARMIESLERSVSSGASAGGDVDSWEGDLLSVRTKMMEEGLYPSSIGDSPAILESLEDLLGGSVEELERRVDAAAGRLEGETWVLLDGEVPIDRLWVLIVYAALVAMIAINLSKLRLFWAARRS